METSFLSQTPISNASTREAQLNYRKARRAFRAVDRSWSGRPSERANYEADWKSAMVALAEARQRLDAQEKRVTGGGWAAAVLADERFA